MTNISTEFGGTDPSDGDVLYAADWKDTFDAVGTGIGLNAFVVRRTQSDSTSFAAANDWKVALSETVWVAWDDSDKSLNRTINSGGAWSEVQDLTATGDDFDQVYVNPNDANYLIVYNMSDWTAEAWYSTDNGATWTEVSSTPDNADANNIAYSITDSGRIYALTNDGGNPECWYTDDGGTGWTEISGFTTTDAPTGDVYIASPSNGVVVMAWDDGNDSNGAYTIDNGSAWTELRTPGTAAVNIYAAFYTDANNYYFDVRVAGAEGGIHIVRFGGTTHYSSGTDNFYGKGEGSSNTTAIPLQFDANWLVYSMADSTADQFCVVGYDSSAYTYVKPAAVTFNSIGDQYNFWGCGVSVDSGKHRIFRTKHLEGDYSFTGQIGNSDTIEWWDIIPLS